MRPGEDLLHQEPRDQKDLLEEPEEVETRQDSFNRGHKSLHKEKLHLNSKLGNNQQNSSILEEDRRTSQEAQTMKETTDYSFSE